MPQLVLHFVCLPLLGTTFIFLPFPCSCLCCLLVYLTLIANAHRDLANDELDWGKITRCFPRHRYRYSHTHTHTAHVILENVVCLPAWGCRVNSELSSLNPWVCSVINAPHTVDLPTEHAVGHCLWYRICFSFLSTNKMSIQLQLLSLSFPDFKHCLDNDTSYKYLTVHLLHLRLSNKRIYKLIKYLIETANSCEKVNNY